MCICVHVCVYKAHFFQLTKSKFFFLKCSFNYIKDKRKTQI